jgi:hypothetical protein
LYLTVEQVRQAACAWIAAQSLVAAGRLGIYRKTAKRIGYHQKRNRQARQSHTKTTVQRLRSLGIDVHRLPSCKPDELCHDQPAL